MSTMFDRDEFGCGLGEIDCREEDEEEKAVAEWDVSKPVPDGFRMRDGDPENGPCKPYLEPIQYEDCDECHKADVEVVRVTTCNPADPTAVYHLACGHVVI